MRKSRRPATPTAIYTRARFYGAIEIALVGLLVILGAMRGSGAEPQGGGTPAQGSAAPAQPPDVEARLGKADLWERLDALENVRRGKARAKRETLDRLFKTGRPALVRVRALQAIAAKGDAQARAALLAALKDKDPMVRQAAAQELGNYAAGEAEAKALAVAAKGDSAGEVRRAALGSVGLSERPEALDALDSASRDHDPELRAEAADGLRRHRGAASKRLLDRLKGDADEAVRRRANGVRDQAGGRAEP